MGELLMTKVDARSGWQEPGAPVQNLWIEDGDDRDTLGLKFGEEHYVTRGLYLTRRQVLVLWELIGEWLEKRGDVVMERCNAG